MLWQLVSQRCRNIVLRALDPPTSSRPAGNANKVRKIIAKSVADILIPKHRHATRHLHRETAASHAQGKNHAKVLTSE
jgi:hypothetical protein